MWFTKGKRWPTFWTLMKRKGNSWFITSHVSKQERRRQKSSSVDVWHERIVHAWQAVIQEMDTGSKCFLRPVSGPTIPLCETCIHSPNTENLFQRNQTDENSEEHYPYRCLRSNMDRHCRRRNNVWNFYCRSPLLWKSRFDRDSDRIRDHCCRFTAWIKRVNSKDGKNVQSDNVKEFLQMDAVLEELCFVYATSTRYCPKSNKNMERMNKTLLDKVRSMLLESFPPLNFWEEALNHAANLHNSILSYTINHTPYEPLLGITTDNTKLKIFRCAAFIYIYKQARDYKTWRPFPVGNVTGNIKWTFWCWNHVTKNDFCVQTC